MQTTFTVPDISCGHCAARVKAAVAKLDATARVEVDVDTKVVRVESGRTGADLETAIRSAGFTPSPAVASN